MGCNVTPFYKTTKRTDNERTLVSGRPQEFPPNILFRQTFTVGEHMEDDILSDVVLSNIVSRQVSTQDTRASLTLTSTLAKPRRRRRERI